MLWDTGAPDAEAFTAAYCRGCKSVCADCPQPRLLPEAAPAAAAYMACSTQWQHGPSGLPTGLRAADCLALLRLYARELGLKKSDLPEVFALVQVIERALVVACAETAEREALQREQSRH